MLLLPLVSRVPAGKRCSARLWVPTKKEFVGASESFRVLRPGS